MAIIRLSCHFKMSADDNAKQPENPATIIIFHLAINSTFLKTLKKFVSLKL